MGESRSILEHSQGSIWTPNDHSNRSVLTGDAMGTNNRHTQFVGSVGTAVMFVRMKGLEPSRAIVAH